MRISLGRHVCPAALVLLSFAVSPRAHAQTSGPAAAYSFSESSGSIAGDASGTGNDATLRDASARSIDGRFGGGLSFDGGTNGLTPPVTSTLALTGPFTIEAWIKPSPTGGNHTIVYRPDDLLFIVLPTGTLYVTANLSGGYRALQGSALALQWGAWSHVALTYDGAALRVYLNGLEVGAASASGALPSTSNPLQVGGVQYNSPLIGCLDEVRLYARALSAAELAMDSVTPVDTMLPFEISTRRPQQGALGIVNSSVSVVFSHPVDEESLTTTTFELRDPSTALVPATVSYDPSTRTATLAPTRALSPLAEYTARVVGGENGVLDSTESALGSDEVWTFRTAAPDTTPSASFSLNEMTGSVAGDSSGNGNAARMVNGPAWTASGRFGGALTFDGVNDGLELSASETLAFTNAFTFEAWVRPTSVTATPLLWITPSVNLGINPYGPLYATASLSGGYAELYSPANLMPTNSWSHVAMTYDATALRLYIDGTLAATQPATGVLPVMPWKMHIAGPMYGSTFLGTLDDIRLYRRALTEDEIWMDSQSPIDGSLPLQVADTTPGAGALGVMRTTATATFSRPIDPSTLTTSTFEWRNSANVIVPTTLAYDAATRTATLSPTASLAPLATYRLRVIGGSSGLHDASGTALASDFIWTFRTAAADTAPAAAYAFNERTGIAAADSSGNGNTATLANGTKWATGKFGTGVSGDGIDDYIRLPLSESLQLTNGFTFEAWVRPTDFGANRYVWMANGGGVVIWTNGYLYAASPKDGAAVWSSKPIALNTWSHIAYAYDGAALRLYINGVQVGSTPSNGTIPSFQSPMFLGYTSFSGGLDDVRIYRRGLTAAEIAADMNAAIFCAYSTSPTSVSSPGHGTSGVFFVTALPGCTWTPKSNATWVTATADGDSVRYIVAPNTTTSTRRTTIIVAPNVSVSIAQKRRQGK